MRKKDVIVLGLTGLAGAVGAAAVAGMEIPSVVAGLGDLGRKDGTVSTCVSYRYLESDRNCQGNPAIISGPFRWYYSNGYECAFRADSFAPRETLVCTPDKPRSTRIFRR